MSQEIVSIKTSTDGFVAVVFHAFTEHSFEIKLNTQGEDTLSLTLRTIPVLMELDAQVALSFDNPRGYRISISHIRLAKRFFEKNTFRNMESPLYEYSFGFKE
jgi:hypothetical protein